MHRIVWIGKSYATGRSIETHVRHRGNVAHLTFYSDHGDVYATEVTREQLQDLRHAIDEAIEAIDLNEKGG